MRPVCVWFGIRRLLHDITYVSKNLAFWRGHLELGGPGAHLSVMLLARGPVSFVKDLAAMLRQQEQDDATSATEKIQRRVRKPCMQARACPAAGSRRQAGSVCLCIHQSERKTPTVNSSRRVTGAACPARWPFPSVLPAGRAPEGAAVAACVRAVAGDTCGRCGSAPTPRRMRQRVQRPGPASPAALPCACARAQRMQGGRRDTLIRSHTHK